MALGLATARADIIPSFQAGIASGGNTDWTYTINITAEQAANTGDFFTIYDFGDFIASSNMQPAGWTFSSGFLGTNPPQTTPVDNPSLLNLTWTYSGPTILGSTPAGQNIGPFSVATSGVSEEPILRNTVFAAQGTLVVGPNSGSKVNNVGQIVVPAVVPEPSVLTLIIGTAGAGFIGRAAYRRRRL